MSWQIGVAKQINDLRGNDTLQWTVRPFSKMEVQPERLTDRSLHSRRHGDTHSSASVNRATPWVPRSAFARKRQLSVCSPSLALRPSRRASTQASLHLNLYFCHRQTPAHLVSPASNSIKSTFYLLFVCFYLKLKIIP